MLEQRPNEEQSVTHCRKHRPRPNYQLMDPDEVTPEERLDRVVELLALASLEAASDGDVFGSHIATEI